MSPVSRENSPNRNEANSSPPDEHSDSVGRESVSDNGIVDNIAIVNNQSDHSSSVEQRASQHRPADESDASDDELLNDTNKKRLFYRNMIVYFGREFIVFLILLLTTYATYHNM